MKPPAADIQHQSPVFIATIDTEGDNLWNRESRTITTRNAAFLPRFQSLCESCGIRPTYLTDHEMSISGDFKDFGRDLLQRGAGEIGMHLHAWNTPPLSPLTPDDNFFKPYLIEYPRQVMQDKIAFMTDLLEETFGVKVVSHRAGRFSFNTVYASLLVKYGYRVDCSVTPRVSWRRTPGDPARRSGTDFLSFPEDPYFVNLSDIRLPGESPLLEVPVSIVARTPLFLPGLLSVASRLPRVAWVVARRLFGSVTWLYPNHNSRERMLGIVARGVAKRKPHLAFIIHSSELMPGGSPWFSTERHIETLYEDLEALFTFAHETCRCLTLKEYYEHLLSQSAASPASAPTPGY